MIDYGEVDAIYVIGLKECSQRWHRVKTWASHNSIRITPVYATSYENVNLRQPPIPVAGVPAADNVRAGQVACTTSHVKTWRHAFSQNHSRIIVLEDDVIITPSLLQRLPQAFRDADEGSNRSGLRWHFIFLRTQSSAPETWRGRATWYGQVRVASPGWGTAAYAVSRDGIRYLLTRITSYAHPLDVQIERLQKGHDTQGAKLVALDVCSSQPGCPENVAEIPPSERGSCFFSASQAGNSVTGNEMPGPIPRPLSQSLKND